MAERKRTSSLSFLPKKCEMCLGTFRDPKVLPCFHIACRDCIKALQVGDIETFKCPVNGCSKTFKCDKMDPESLPDALVAYHWIDFTDFKKKIDKKAYVCNVCDKKGLREEIAVAVCDQCNHICQKCHKLHLDEVIRYSDHNVVPHIELSSQEGDDLGMEVLKRSRSRSFIQKRNECKLHHEECYSFCLDCKVFVCPICIDTDHTRHHYRASDIAAEESVKIIADSMPEIKLGQSKINEAVESIKKHKCHVEEQQDAISSNIDAEFNHLMKILERRKQSLHSELNDLTKSKISKLTKQKNNLERLSSEMERMIIFAESSIVTSTPHELLTNYPFLHDKIQEGSRRILAAELHPIAIANTAFKCSARNEIKNLSQRNLVVYSKQADPKICSIEREGLKRAEVMRKIQMIVNIVDQNGKPCSSIQDVTGKLKRCENGVDSTAVVFQENMGRYRIEINPEFRGEHEIHISVNGQAISGSPCTFNVHMPPIQLGRAQSFHGIYDVQFKRPRGIVFSPSGDILVSEWQGQKIIKLDKHGYQLSALDIACHPASLAVSDAGNIFVIGGSEIKYGIIKCNKQGKILKSIQGEGEEVCRFKNPRGIKIGPKGKEVFICDKDNYRIQVYDTDLNFHRCIDLRKLNVSLKATPEPNDLAFDRDGNIFIADCANNYIHRLNSMEQYVSTFPYNKDFLAGPECLIVDNFGNLYITESRNHCVSVFKTSGEFITTFGSHGEKEGEFKFPMGIALDQSGYLFVCDHWNNRVQVF